MTNVLYGASHASRSYIATSWSLTNNPTHAFDSTSLETVPKKQ
jgi:hypothetical protein